MSKSTLKYFRELETKYNDHPLFARCITANVPVGWLGLIDELVVWLDNYNVSNKTLIGFAQIKLKFNMLTIYVEHYDNDVKDLLDSGMHLSNARQKISSICNKSFSTCKVCGKIKTEMVVDSKIKNVCLDHINTESEWWRKRI
jgi:hypothetical protein